MTRVLHVDDERVVRDQVRKILEPHFEWVGSVEDGSAVLEFVTKLLPDVVLLDISLPGRSGFEVARELRRSAPEVKVIFLTVHSHDAYVREALRMGVAGYVLKSASASELEAAVRAAVAGETYVSSRLRGIIGRG